MGVLKESIKYYKDRKREEKAKKRLINKKMDFHLLEQLIQQCNDNPALRIEINLVDGTKLLLKTYVPKNDIDPFNGNYEVIG